MLNELSVISGGGKSGGGGEANDTLRSVQVAKVLFAVNDGLCGMDADHLPEIYLNNVISSNYQVIIDYRPGTEDQGSIANFVYAESPFSWTPTELTNKTLVTTNISTGSDGSTYDTYTYGTNTSPTPVAVPWYFSSVRLTFSLNSLRSIKKDGSIVGSSVIVAIQTKATSDASLVFNTFLPKAGKASGIFTFDHIVTRPSDYIEGSDWYVYVSRFSPDAADAKTENKISLAAVTGQTNVPQTYPGTSLIALTLLNALQFGNAVPTILFKFRGTLVFLPNNYNPDTRTYFGTWNGTFKLQKEYTANPFWLIYHFLTQNLKINPNYIDIGKFYSLAVYADEQISDGYGSYVPRYSIHYQFNEKLNVIAFFEYFLAITNSSWTKNELGQLSLTCDKPGEAIKHIITNANVEGGLFTYQSTDYETRYSEVSCTFEDILNKGKRSYTTAFSDASHLVAGQNLKNRYGFQPHQVALPGCIYEAQAIRKARHVLYTNAIQTEIVHFKQGLEGAFKFIGDLIEIRDDKRPNSLAQGRILHVTKSDVVTYLSLDRKITLDATTVYKITYVNSSGTIESELTIRESNGSFDTISYVGIDKTPINGSVFAIYSSEVPMILYKIISKELGSDGLYTFSALIHYEEKFAYVESGISLSAPQGDFIPISYDAPATPHDGTVVENTSIIFGNPNHNLDISWKGGDEKTTTYNLSYSVDNGSPITVRDISQKNYTIENAKPGDYSFTIVSVNNYSGATSSGYTFTYSFKTGSTSTLEPPTNIFVDGTTGTTFTDENLSVKIVYNMANGNSVDKQKDYFVEIYNSDFSTVLNSFYVERNPDFNGYFTLTFKKIKEIYGTSSRNVYVKTYSRDIYLNLSSSVSATFTNLIPSAPSSVDFSGNGGNVHIKPSFSDTDIDKIRIYRSSTSGFTPGSENLLYLGSNLNPSFASTGGTTYYYIIGLIDVFGEDGINLSTEYSYNSPATSGATGDLTETTSNVLTISGGSGAVLGSGTTIQVKQASASQDGYLSSADWTTFNGKISSIKTLNSNSLSGSGDLDFGTVINGLTSKTTPINGDYLPLMDSAASNVLKKLSLSDLKAYLNTFYSPVTSPFRSSSAATTTTLSDANGIILHPTSDTSARIFTIASNATVAYPTGTSITFINQTGAGIVTIAITSDTLQFLNGSTVSTGSRTLAANGSATAIKITSTLWVIYGVGLT